MRKSWQPYRWVAALSLRSVMTLLGSALCGAALAQQSVGGASISDLPEIRVQKPGVKTVVPVCDEIRSMVEDDVKSMAESTMDTGNDVVSQLRKLTSIGQIQANLTLMQANKCQLPKSAVDYRPYLYSASRCAIAKSAAQRAGSNARPLECDRDTWTRESR